MSASMTSYGHCCKISTPPVFWIWGRPGYLPYLSHKHGGNKEMLLWGSPCCYVASLQSFAFQDGFESSLFLEIIWSFVSTQRRTAKFDFFTIKTCPNQIQQNCNKIRFPFWPHLWCYQFSISLSFSCLGFLAYFW